MKKEILKKEILKKKVINKLIAGGFNEKTVYDMVKKEFDYAFSHYNTLKTICECITTIYSKS